jgi:hypothetical protein
MSCIPGSPERLGRTSRITFRNVLLSHVSINVQARGRAHCVAELGFERQTRGQLPTREQRSKLTRKKHNILMYLLIFPDYSALRATPFKHHARVRSRPRSKDDRLDVDRFLSPKTASVTSTFVVDSATRSPRAFHAETAERSSGYKRRRSWKWRTQIDL